MVVTTKYNEIHKKMVVWESIEKLAVIMIDVLSCIDEHEFKTRSQIINAHDSISSNFVEGYYSGYDKEFIRFLKYSRRSAAELFDRVSGQFQRKVIGESLYERFEERCVKTMYLLDRTKQWLENKNK